MSIFDRNNTQCEPVEAQIVTSHGEKLKGIVRTSKKLEIQNHCHKTKLTLSQIHSIKIKDKFTSSPERNQYEVKTRTGNVYLGQINSSLTINIDNNRFSFNTYEIQSLEPVYN